jgi:TDG/mug DNA glycosylase family protein
VTAEVQSFEPVVGRHPRIIILGSMPGIASLEAVQYYAHPRNAFWPIMGELFGIDHQLSYQERIQQVHELPVILWDTLKSCHRPGSLDSNISRDSAAANDIPALVERYPDIRAIAFNGATSEKFFRQLVMKQLANSDIKLIRLPSTSPANAGMNFAQKLEVWRQLLEFID